VIPIPFDIPNYGDAAHPFQAAPDSVDFDIVAAGAGMSGVIAGCDVTAQGSPDMTVHVAAGRIALVGVIAAVGATDPVIGVAHASLPRIDLVVVSGVGVVSVVPGVAAVMPVMAAPGSDVVLAAVYVPALCAAITAAEITDKRVDVISSRVQTTTVPPTAPNDGDLWFDEMTGRTFIWWNDGTSAQWVELGIPVTGNPGQTGLQGPPGPAGTIATLATPPVAPVDGDLWFNENNGRTFLWWDDGSSSQWVEVGAPMSGPPGLTGPVSTVPGPATDWTTAQTLRNEVDSYLLDVSDVGKLVTFTKGTAVNCTVPVSLMAIGQRIDIAQLGAGQVTVVASGTTVVATPSLRLRALGSAATLICIATNTYLLVGDLA